MGQGLGLSDAVGDFLGEYQAGKRRQEEERQRLLIEALRQRQFDETQASNLFRREQAETGNIFREQEAGRTEAHRQFQRGQAETRKGFNLTPGQERWEWDENTGRAVMVARADPKPGKEIEMRDEAFTIAASQAGAGWDDLSSAQQQQWIDNVMAQLQRGDLSPQPPKITERSPGIDRFDFGTGLRDESAVADTSFITPGQGFQQGQGGQGDSLAQAIAELKAEGIPDEQIQQALRNMGLIK